MMLKRIALFVLLGIVTVAFFVPFVLADITVPSETHFTYSNGTYFTHPGTYSKISLVDNVWYFNDVAYLPLSGTLTPTPNPEEQNAINNVFNNMYIALGLIGISLIVMSCFIILKSMEDAESNPLPGFIILLGTIVGLVVAFLIISAFQNSFL